MRVVLPFLFQVMVEDQKTGKTVNSWFCDHAYADVPEISARETDLVVEWKENWGLQDSKHVVHWNGRLYSRASESAKVLAPSVLPRSPDEIKARNPSGAARASLNTSVLSRIYGFPNGTEARMLDYALAGKPRPYALTKAQKALSSTYDVDRAEGQAMVSDLMIRDGDVYQAVPSIFICVENRQFAERACIYPRFGATGSFKRELLSGWRGLHRHTIEMHFPLSEVDHAASVAGEGAEMSVSALRVHRPDLAGSEGDTETYARQMNYAVRTLIETVGSMDMSEAALWLNVRDAVEKHFSVDRIPVSETAIEDFRELVARHPDPDCARILRTAIVAIDAKNGLANSPASRALAF